MLDIEDIRNAIQANHILITDHAHEEALEDTLTLDQIYFSAQWGEIIEDYSKDKPYPSCLIYGQTFSEEPVHSVWAYNDLTKFAVLITVYRPDPNRWINHKKRKKI
ncbi:MAG: hypothetical protein ACI9CF_001796 [Candidatus Omnitrophota bacterium]|jgi:hypothetical protein